MKVADRASLPIWGAILPILEAPIYGEIPAILQDNFINFWSANLSGTSTNLRSNSTNLWGNSTGLRGTRGVVVPEREVLPASGSALPAG